MASPIESLANTPFDRLDLQPLLGRALIDLNERCRVLCYTPGQASGSFKREVSVETPRAGSRLLTCSIAVFVQDEVVYFQALLFKGPFKDDFFPRLVAANPSRMVGSFPKAGGSLVTTWSEM